MRATNPREVGLIFREYARKIHAKASPSDPCFIRISVACGKVCPSASYPFTSFSLRLPRSNHGVNTITPPLSSTTPKLASSPLTHLTHAPALSCSNSAVMLSSQRRNAPRTNGMVLCPQMEVLVLRSWRQRTLAWGS